MKEHLCDCFGASGLHASTHTTAGGRICCDLCGRPVYPRWRKVREWFRSLLPRRRRKPADLDDEIPF